VARFVSEYGLTFPVWLDPHQEALAAFRNLSLPSSYVIDRQGQVRLAWVGAVSLRTLEKYVTPIIKE
jgi:peroxiredoxin